MITHTALIHIVLTYTFLSNGNVSMVTIAIKSRFNKNTFEHQAWEKNMLVAGIDEVGRGCLAGPVVTAAVILQPNKISRLIKDSKLLTPEELHKAYQWIIKNSWYSIGIIHHRDIDQYNIYHATLRAMKRSLMQILHTCPKAPSKILIDAMPLQLTQPPFDSLEIVHFIKGELRSSSIAAASIIAKVKRDQMMRIFDPALPGYDLKSHKGYSTPNHKKMISQLQHSIIHRSTFIKDKNYFLESSDATQQSLITSEEKNIDLL